MDDFTDLETAMLYCNKASLTARESEILSSCIASASGLIVEELGADPRDNPLFAKETFGGLKSVAAKLAARLFFEISRETIGVAEGKFQNIEYKNRPAVYFDSVDEYSLRRYRATPMTA